MQLKPAAFIAGRQHWPAPAAKPGLDEFMISVKKRKSSINNRYNLPLLCEGSA
jgi:hypothetical protein